MQHKYTLCTSTQRHIEKDKIESPCLISAVVKLLFIEKCLSVLLGYSEMFPRKRRKRYRTIFSESQIETLEKVYKLTPYPDLFMREEVAMKTGIQEERVEVIIETSFLKVFSGLSVPCCSWYGGQTSHSQHAIYGHFLKFLMIIQEGKYGVHHWEIKKELRAD
jgi:hypothetical protein